MIIFYLLLCLRVVDHLTIYFTPYRYDFLQIVDTYKYIAGGSQFYVFSRVSGLLSGNNPDTLLKI